MEDFKRLEIARKRTGNNQQNFAVSIGYGQPYYNEIENGNKNISYRMLKVLYSTHDISPLYILTGEGPVFVKELLAKLEKTQTTYINEPSAPYTKPPSKMNKSELAISILDTGKLLDEMKRIYNEIK